MKALNSLQTQGFTLIIMFCLRSLLERERWIYFIIFYRQTKGLMIYIQVLLHVWSNILFLLFSCGEPIMSFKFLMLWFQAVGCVLISIASWITHFAKLYQDLFIDDNLLVVTSLLIAVGTFLFIFSFIGCLGALKEGPFILKLVSFLTVYFLKSFPLYFNFIFRSVCLSE